MINKSYIIAPPCSGKSTFINSYENEYKILRLFDEQLLPSYLCNLGGNCILDQEKYIYAIVLIREAQLRKQIAKRKKQDPGNAWTEELIFDHPTQGYYAVKQTAKEHNIPVFKTFEDASNFIIVKMIENE